MMIEDKALGATFCACLLLLFALICCVAVLARDVVEMAK